MNSSLSLSTFLFSEFSTFKETSFLKIIDSSAFSVEVGLELCLKFLLRLHAPEKRWREQSGTVERKRALAEKHDCCALCTIATSFLSWARWWRGQLMLYFWSWLLQVLWNTFCIALDASTTTVSQKMHIKIKSLQLNLLLLNSKYLEIKYTATQVIRGLAYMHNVRNIVHL